MNTLTARIAEIIANQNLNETFYLIDNLIFVNVDFLINRQYQFEGVNEFLYFIGQHRNRTVIFLQRDGANLRYTGALALIQQTIMDLDLTEQSCFFYGYENYNLQNCTYLELDVIQMWCSLIYGCVGGIVPSNPHYEYHFAGLFGRYELYRLKLYQHLCSKKSLLSWNASSVYINQRFAKCHEHDLQWFSQHTASSLDFESGHGSVSYQTSLASISTHYNRYFLEVVAETDTHGNCFFTEKTLKNFYLGKPFLLLNGVNSLKKLQQYGFKTFAPYINEEYDTCTNTYERICCIMKEIDRINHMTVDQLKTINHALGPILEHNRKMFEWVAMGKNS
jgi:hypothetical protein